LPASPKNFPKAGQLPEDSQGHLIVLSLAKGAFIKKAPFFLQ